MRIWFVSEVFDASGVTTGYYLARIAQALGQRHDVRVITTKRGAHDGPRLEHLAASVTQRGVRTLLSSFRLAARALFGLRRGDVAIAVTNPPALPILMALVAKVRGARLVVVVHDIYPDVLLAANVWRRNSKIAKLFDRLNLHALASAERIVVIGRDMERKLASRLNGAAARIEFIPNWANEDIVVLPKQPVRPFVVQYSGNMGVTHGVESLIECAVSHDTPDSDIRFELIGWGLKLPYVRAEIERRRLRNLTVLPPVPRAQLGVQLARCDVALILMIEGTGGVSVPCRLYNIMAAGKPVIVAADEDSEIAEIVRDSRIGWVVAPGSPHQLAAAVHEASTTDAAELAAMGARGRARVTELYSFDRAASAYARLMSSIERGRA